MNEDCFMIPLVWLFSLRGLPASLTVDAFNTVIELLLCAPLDPSIGQCSRRSQYSLYLEVLMPVVWMERPSDFCG